MSESPTTYAIYQIKNIDDLADLRYMSLSSLASRDKCVEGKNYDKIYSGTLADRFKERDSQLEALFVKFNLYHPEDFKGHSMSVSDVVVLEKDGKASAYFCDSIGFKEVPQFFDSLPEKVKPSLDVQIQDAKSREKDAGKESVAKDKNQQPML